MRFAGLPHPIENRFAASSGTTISKAAPALISRPDLANRRAVGSRSPDRSVCSANALASLVGSATTPRTTVLPLDGWSSEAMDSEHGNSREGAAPVSLVDDPTDGVAPEAGRLDVVVDVGEHVVNTSTARAPPTW